MAISPSGQRGVRVSFYHNNDKDYPTSTFEVAILDGQEALSVPYRFDLELASRDPEIDLDKILADGARIGIRQAVEIPGQEKPGHQKHLIHGILSHFEETDFRDDWYLFRAVLVPRLWRLSLNLQTRVFLDKDVQGIVEEVLAADPEIQFEFNISSRTYPTREYVLQNEEDDLSFLHRTLEHEGISYYFKQGEDAETIVFTDANESFVPIVGNADVPYRPVRPDSGKQQYDWLGLEAVQRVTYRNRLVQKDVDLKDWNYRTLLTLSEKGSVTDDGFGTHYEYGNHFKDSEEGKKLAQIRAEELLCRKKTYQGSGDVKSFRAGHTFQLKDHARFKGELLIVEVRHRVEQAISLDRSAGGLTFYGNEFQCIPADVTFRPKRVTPKPRLAGAINATIDSSGDGQYAEIDDQGRYKVQMPFDQSGREGGKASRYVRMAQPYSGADYGFHFPLHKKTEVMMIHSGGDGDRPVIMATLPNPENSSPVNADNHTQCVIRTGGSNEIAIEDQEGNERIKLTTPYANTLIQMGSMNDENEGISEKTDKSIMVAAGEFYNAVAGHNMGLAASKFLDMAGYGGVSIYSGVLGGLAGYGRDVLTKDLAENDKEVMKMGMGYLRGAVSAASKAYVMSSGTEKPIGFGSLVSSILDPLASITLMAEGGCSMIGNGPTGGIYLASLFDDIKMYGKKGIVGVSPEHVLLVGRKGGNKGGVEIRQSVNNSLQVREDGLWVRAMDGTARIYCKERFDFQCQDFLSGLCTNLNDSKKLVLYANGSTVSSEQPTASITLEDKKITLQAGESVITMEDKKVTIASTEIVAQTHDGKGKLQLDDGGCASALLYAKKDLALHSDANTDIDTAAMLFLNGKKQIKMKTPDLDEKGASSIARANSTEK